MGKILLSNPNDEWLFGVEPTKNFPNCLYWIYEDHIWFNHHKNVPKIVVRRFIERQLDGDVWVSEGQFEKRTHKSAWDTAGTGVVRYLIFRFEEESDVIAFKLNFNNVADQEKIEELKNTETQYEKERRKAIENGEYWEDRRY